MEPLDIIALESRIKLLEEENTVLKSFVIKMGDRLVRNAEKLSNNAERTKASAQQLKQRYLKEAHGSNNAEHLD